jgi:hypothetical protein
MKDLERKFLSLGGKREKFVAFEVEVNKFMRKKSK